jgi:RNA ligase
MRIDLERVQPYIDGKFITRRKHPELELYILNYTHKTQYENKWDEITEMCRGLIVDVDGNIISRPFRKFFNLNQRPETQIDNLPREIPQVTVKADGSLGILGYIENDVFIATRGSFDSEAARWATAWVKEKGWTRKDFKDGYTYLYEIISPVSRIVVDYKGKDALVLLAVIQTETGEEIDHIPEAKRLNIPYAEVVEFTSIKAVEEHIKNAKVSGLEAEGFVCRYSNGLRVKFKYEDYKRLHKVLTGLSTTSIWDALRTNTFDDLLEFIPDEMFGWVHKQKDALILEKTDLEERVNTFFTEKDLRGLSRKEQAEIIKTLPKHLRILAFHRLDGRKDRAEEMMWKIIKPEFQVYRVDNDEDA